MKYFSDRQRLQHFWPGLYVWHCLIIWKSMSGFGFSLLCQMYVDRVVSLLYLMCLKDLMWFLYLSLNVVVVMPMYSASFPSLTVALYITFFEGHDAVFIGHFFDFWQLQGGVLISFVLLSSLLFLFCMIVFMFGVQL